MNDRQRKWRAAHFDRLAKLSIGIMLTALALARNLSAATEETPQGKPTGLLAAILAEEVRVEARGTGASAGDCLRLEVSNLTDQEKFWFLPPGIVALSQDPGAPDMAIRAIQGKLFDAKRFEPSKTIHLGPAESAAYICEAYSMDFKKGTPGAATRFRLGAPQPFLQCLFNEARDTQPSLRALQAAIWIYYSKTTREELTRQFPVSSPDFALAQGMVRVCEAKAGDGKIQETPGEDGEFDFLKMPEGYVPLTYTDDESDKEAKPAEDLTLKAGAAVFSQEDDEYTLSVPLKFKWNVPPDERARICAAVMRFESPAMTSAVMAANLDFGETEGRYDMVVKQGKLNGRGELVYAVFGNLTTASLQPDLEKLFKAGENEQSRRISNWLRIPLDWDKGMQPGPAEKAAAGVSVSPLLEKALSVVEDIGKAKGGEPTPRPRLTPVPLEERDWPVWIDLPLRNGGVLRGDLHGMQDGKMVVEIGSRRILFDPNRLKHSPRELLDEARAAFNGDHKFSARQYAAVAMLLLDEPTEARELFEKSR